MLAKPKAGPSTVTGFKTPESVLYDAEADVYLVSNINGDPFGTDDNGFIAKVTADGKMETWIDGAKEDVKLDAPKGMALLGDTLYVADITTVRMFDRKSGAAKGEVAIKGATFLNDLAAGTDAVYVSDSGLGAGFKPEVVTMAAAPGPTRTVTSVRSPPTRPPPTLASAATATSPQSCRGKNARNGVFW